MDIGVIIALCVAVTLTLIAGVAAGLFGGMWWQARKTAEVWEKTYTHMREQLNYITTDTYNTGRGKERRDPRTWDTPEPPEGLMHVRRTAQPAEAPLDRERVRVQADIAPAPPPVQLPPVVPSANAQRLADTFELDDDPLGPQVKR